MDPKEKEAKRKAARERLQKLVTANRKNRRTANLRRIAEEEPQEVGSALAELGQAFQDAADVLSGLASDTGALQENLDLGEPGKEASLKARVAARRNYAKSLRRLANEEPEQLGAALSEVYAQLDEVASGIEALADNFGLPLEMPESTDKPDEQAAAQTDEDSVPAGGDPREPGFQEEMPEDRAA